MLGSTVSQDLPATDGAYDETFNGSSDNVLAKLSADGTQLLHSTYLGSTTDDYGMVLALDTGEKVRKVDDTRSAKRLVLIE